MDKTTQERQLKLKELPMVQLRHEIAELEALKEKQEASDREREEWRERIERLSKIAEDWLINYLKR